MSVINALSGRMCVCARGTNQQVPNSSLGPCVHYLIPLRTSLTALYFKHTQGARGGRGIIGAVTSCRLTKVIGTITLKDLRLTCFVKDLRGYGSDVCVWIKRHAWWHHESQVNTASCISVASCQEFPKRRLKDRICLHQHSLVLPRHVVRTEQCSV